MKLEQVTYDTPDGPILTVSGVDLLDGTPIYDIKPYLPYVDAHPEAAGGFSDVHSKDGIRVEFPEALLVKLPWYSLLHHFEHHPKTFDIPFSC